MLGDEGGDASLGFEIEALACAISGIDGAGFQPGATMNTTNQALFRYGIEIATNGLWRDRKVFGQLLDTGIALAAYQLDDRLLALLLVHGDSLVSHECKWDYTKEEMQSERARVFLVSINEHYSDRTCHA